MPPPQTASFRRRPRAAPFKVLPVVVLNLGLCGWTGAASAQADPPDTSEDVEEVIGITTPNQEAVLAAIGPGRIASIHIPEGGQVREGELVFAQDEQAQRIRTEIARAAAESTIEIDLARAGWQRAQRDFDRLSGLYGNDSASSKELSDARAEADITRLEYESALFKQQQSKRAHQWESQRLRDFHALAPFTGFVTEHLRHVGETVDESEGVVRLVQLDPLKVSVDCPLTLARSVQQGDRLMVRPIDPRWEPRRSTVVMAGRVIDAASQTFRVKLSVDNADAGWMAGLKVAVQFPTAVDAVRSRSQPEASTSAVDPRANVASGGEPDVKQP